MSGTGKGHGRAAGAALGLALACLCAACVARWEVRSVRPQIHLQWPYQPNEPKVVYDRALTGFADNERVRSTLRSVLFGEDPEDRSSFVLPVAVAVGADGRIAVADMGRRCVHLYLPHERRYVQFVGSDKERIQSPVALVFDDESRLYLSDSSGTVVSLDADGKVRFVLRAAGPEKFQRPTGLAYSPREKLVYVVDTLANRVHAFRDDGDFAFSFGRRGEGAGQFNFPTHIFWGPPGELYVTNALNFRIEIFDERGGPVGSFGRHGDGSGDLARPKGIAVDGDGIIYVVDGLFDAVQLFRRDGTFLLTLGQRGVDFGEFWLPSGAFLGHNGELYVCDTYNRRIQVFRVMERRSGGDS